MNEWTLVLLVPVRLGIVLVFALLYVIGGRFKKWIRRLGGGIFLGVSIIGLSFLTGRFSWWFLALPALYPIALSMGYGSSVLWEKIVLRALYGAFLGGIGLFVGVMAGNWFMAGFQFALAVIASVSLGVRNPLEAVNEEALIATFSVICVPFMI